MLCSLITLLEKQPSVWWSATSLGGSIPISEQNTPRRRYFLRSGFMLFHLVLSCMPDEPVCMDTQQADWGSSQPGQNGLSDEELCVVLGILAIS